MKAAPNTRKKGRISKQAICIRKNSNTARIPSKFMVDSKHFSPEVYVNSTSSKYSALVSKIKELDAEDLAAHGTKFKHFIFTDIRESAYGAKAIAGFLIAGGFEFRMKHVLRMIRRGGKDVQTRNGSTQLIEKDSVHGGSNGFAMLQSLPLWQTPLPVDTKKRTLTVFNSRPENIYGELLRIIVLDSKYKEGIDLFDVKYVHLMEPAIASSDLKQAVGRATRFCGQRGLHFIPQRGWPLQVYIYKTLLPHRVPFLIPDNGVVESIDAHELMLANSGLDLALLNITKQLTILAILTSVDYDLNYKINNFSAEPVVLGELENDAVLEMHGGGDRPFEVHDIHEMTPLMIQQCSKRKSRLFPFTKVSMVHHAKHLGIRAPKNAKREWYCQALKEYPELYAALFREINESSKRKFSTSENTPIHIKSLPSKLLNNFNTTPQPRKFINTAYDQKLFPSPEFENTPQPRILKLSKTSKTSKKSNENAAYDRLRKLFPSPEFENTPQPRTYKKSKTSKTSNENAAYNRLRKLFPSPEFENTLQEESLPKPKTSKKLLSIKKLNGSLDFTEFQKQIRSIYSRFAWNSPIVSNGCTSTAIVAPGTPVTFTRTQDFIRHYLTPTSPFKGLLAWHSVGTGKTCMAVATATTDFERAGYTILWVTRNALMADVYKNIFGSVCSIPIANAIRSGMPPAQVQMLRQLIKPISYKMFQNALEMKNDLGRQLWKNGVNDPLRKTFLVIDEIHKLRDGDLSAAEFADFKVIQKFIHQSYTISGNDSVRPLLMTATPISDSPSELFDILNILIPEPARRFMDFDKFRSKFTNSSGEINSDGHTYFQQKAKGLISYLNREYDPTTFAQPEFHTIPIPAGNIEIPSVGALVDKCMDSSIGEAAEEAQLALNTALRQALSMPARERKKAETAARRTYKLDMLSANKTRKARLKACYSKQKGDYTNASSNIQTLAIESCFTGKKTGGSKFPTFPALNAEVEKRLGTAVNEPDIRNSSSIRSTGAVFDY